MARPAAAGMAFRLWGARSAFSAALRGPPAPPRASHARRSSSNSSSSQGQPGGGGGAPKPSPDSSSFKLPGHKPSDWDKRFLLWTGRFKKAEDIPETVSIEMIDAARNKMRVKISYLMIILTVVGCVGMVIAGKRAVGRHESLTSQNMEKKVRWREEAQQATAKP